MPMLIDFGAAREALGSKSHDLTQVLTPKYAPAEQYLSDRTKQGAFTDIYALGITLYLLITNQSASDIPAAPDRQDAVCINNKPDPLKKPEAGKYSQNLIDTIMKMIEIRSKDRPQDCDSVIEMLVSGICSSTKKETFTPDTELSDLDEVAIKESVEDEKQPLLQKKERKAKKKNFLFFIIIAIVVVSLVAAGVIIYQRKAKIFYDKNTGLTWQDNKAAATVKKNWSGAKEYCKNLTLGGYSDWRLPEYSELLSIVDYTKYKPAIKSGFKHVSSNIYWSSSQSVLNSSDAWIVDFYRGDLYDNFESHKHYVRCVRGR